MLKVKIAPHTRYLTTLFQL